VKLTTKLGDKLGASQKSGGAMTHPGRSLESTLSRTTLKFYEKKVKTIVT